METRYLTFLVLVILSSVINVFCLPGLAPNVFCRNSIPASNCKTKVEVFVNRLNSRESFLPYEYSYFPFCMVEDEASPAENLGQVLCGERIHPSPYKFNFLKNKYCQLVCKKLFVATDSQQQKMLERLMKGMILNYQQHWVIDNMPITLCYRNVENQEFCSREFPIGCYVTKSGQSKESCSIRDGKNDTFYLFNHLDFEITYHSGEGETWGAAFGEEGGRIISAKVQVSSLNSDKCDHGAEPIMFQSTTRNVEIPYTYSVKFIKNNDIRWASRWKYILEPLLSTSIHWYSILNSLIIVLFLSGMVSVKLLRILHKDIGRYCQRIDFNHVQESVGWKSIDGDVFRPPEKGMFLSILIGNGVQIAMMSSITLIFAYFDFLSPAKSGALMTCIILCYVLLGTPAGYTSARLYKMFGGKKQKINAMMTAFACPGLVFIIFFVLNLVLWANDSSAAIPYTTFLVLLALWFCVATPLVFIGAYFGFKCSVLENPVQTNEILRQVPKKTLYTRSVPSILMGGIIPFSSIFIELFFILNSIWAGQYYYFFGYLPVVYIILIILCAEVTIILCYFHLCAEDYNWWWRSFLTSGFTAVYLFVYSVYYFITKLEISDSTSTFLYFGYTLMMTFILFLFTGTMGFLACFWFVRIIYSTMKTDETEKVSIIKVPL